jgi:hypothetical protein
VFQRVGVSFAPSQVEVPDPSEPSEREDAEHSASGGALRVCEQAVAIHLPVGLITVGALVLQTT